MSDILKPCPVCKEPVKRGDFNTVWHTWDNHGVDKDYSEVRVECCMTFVFDVDSIAEAITAWNTRPDEWVSEVRGLLEAEIDRHEIPATDNIKRIFELLPQPPQE